MIDRRQFLRGATALAATASVPWSLSFRSRLFADQSALVWTRQYEQMLRASPWLPYVGVPSDWKRVREGFHPFAPERIAIFRSPLPGARIPKEPVLKHCGLLGKKVFDRRNFDNPAFPRPIRDDDWRWISDEKLDVLLSIVGAMAAYYPHPDCFNAWSRGLVWRENFSSTGMGSHWGLVHQFQGWLRSVATMSERVDWWLFLFPEGTEFDALDDQPVYAITGPVFDGDIHRYDQGYTLHLMQQFWQKPAVEWRAISQLGAVEVVCSLNQWFGEYIDLRQRTSEHPYPDSR